MVVSLATFGRIFCGICPHGFIGKYITKIGLKKRLPKKLNNPFIGLFILLVGFWLVAFTFSGIFRGPQNTAIMFLVLTIFAFIIYYIYDEMVYCKVFCPIGTITKVFSKISFTKLESYKEGCSTCKTFDCANACSYNLKPFTFAKKNSMEDCTLCMDCTSACDNIAFNFKKPSSSLFKKFKTNKVEVWALILITGILSFAMTFNHALGRTAIADEFIWVKSSQYLKETFPFITYVDITSLSGLFYSLLLVIGLSIIGMFIASKIMKVPYEKTFYTLGYALVPIFIIGGLTHILEFFFYRTASNIVNGFIQAFLLDFEYINPLATRKDKWVLLFMVFNHIAYIWAFIIMIGRLKLLQSKAILKVFAFPFASLVIIAYMSMTFYTGYVFKTYGAKKGGHNHSAMIKKEVKKNGH